MGIEKMEHKIRGMKDELFSKAVLRAAKVIITLGQFQINSF